MSHHTAHHATTAGAVGLGQKWTARHETYERLVEQSRNLRGLVGNGGHAAGQGAVAATRAMNFDPAETRVDQRELRHLDTLNNHIDRRLCALILTGADGRSYLLRVGLPRLDTETSGTVTPQRHRHIPLDIPGSQAPLLTTVRERLRPATDRQAAETAPDARRDAFASSNDALRRPTTAPRADLSI